MSAQSLLSGRYTEIELHPVRMAFSRQTSHIGRLRFGKLLHLGALVARIHWQRARTGARILYFPPAGPNLVPFLRDVVILVCTRWAFARTVFHFHAAGLSELEARLRGPLRLLYRAAYWAPDVAIQTSALNPPDGQRLQAKRVVVIPNGVPDHPLARQPRPDRAGHPLTILYAGILRESKGLLVLVQACRRLREQGLDFRLHLMGTFESPAFESALGDALASAGLSDRSTFLGVLRDDAKAQAFWRSDVFCYPTHFEAESFGLVVVEAMQFSLPVVATRWRGVPTVVDEGQSGLLVPVCDAEQLADALSVLLENEELRRRLGARGRERYLEHFTEERFRQRMEAALGPLGSPGR